MVQEALRKLQTEMAGAVADSYISYIGAFLMDHVRQNPHHATLIMADGKSISGSLEAMRSEASKKKKNNFAMFTPEQGFEIVLKYYGVSTKKTDSQQVAAAPKLDVSLDDLMV